VLESGRHLYGQGEGIGNVPVRMTLYEIYHAVQCIVREFYRPRADSSKKELDARKRLTDVLARLERWDEPPPPPSPSPSPSPHSSSSGGGGGGGNFRREKSELVEAHERPSADWGGGGGLLWHGWRWRKVQPAKETEDGRHGGCAPFSRCLWQTTEISQQSEWPCWGRRWGRRQGREVFPQLILGAKRWLPTGRMPEKKSLKNQEEAGKNG